MAAIMTSFPGGDADVDLGVDHTGLETCALSPSPDAR